MEPAKITPMMQQYLHIKERYHDAILFFRLGDFYEMFFEDAQTASRILDIALTSRHKSEESPVPLCGVPYHAAEPYIQKLLDAGHKVAVCEQVEDPKTAKGVVQREVVRVITPGTITAAEALDARGNNFLIAVCQDNRNFGLAVTDITTGEFRCTQFADEQSLFEEIGRIAPSEIIAPDNGAGLLRLLRKEFSNLHITAAPEEFFSGEAARKVMAAGEAKDRGSARHQGVFAASGIISYLAANAGEFLKVIGGLEFYVASHYLVLDENTRRNLELVTGNDGTRKGSLLSVIDRTETPMGARRLRQWLFYPLLDVGAIRERQAGVQALVENYRLREDLKSALQNVQDLERLAARTVAGTASPRDLVAIKQTLLALADLRRLLAGENTAILRALYDQLSELPEIVQLIGAAIVDDPPFSLKDGGYIRQGFDPELDEIRSGRTRAKEWIAAFETAERRRTGINSLKVRYNRVFGYYIEITSSNLQAVPGDYIRKQTLANGERYITPELKEYETRVLNSQSLLEKMEAELLGRVRGQVAGNFPVLKKSSLALACIDVLLSLAEVAESCHWVAPSVDDGLILLVREGRHPVVEAAIGRNAFVPNDCAIDPKEQQILLLTGPNMAGKSTYMRQIALITILAQMGSFVPAREARIGLVDRVFTRIGASDSLARGESTFMIEMKETAAILEHATQRSLILLDEVGRGTSTFDGISIAWAVAESLHERAERPRTLFATHYHELTDLARTKERIKNYNFAVKEWQGDIIFLRNLIEGAASRSYGIHVARLAGLPAPVIDHAKSILARLEGGADECRGRSASMENYSGDQPLQMTLFASAEDRFRDQLRSIDVSTITPVEALNILFKLTEDAKK
ncbi:MAG TPA: DNA mismatch repair protein MutS [Candidatus Binatia bacterium]